MRTKDGLAILPLVVVVVVSVQLCDCVFYVTESGPEVDHRSAPSFSAKRTWKEKEEPVLVPLE